MSQSNFLKEVQVLEPEVKCEDRVVKRSQSGKQIEKINLSLRKCQSVDGSLKRKSRNVRKLKTRNLKIPQVPEKIVNIVNILMHENFLKVVDQFFKPTSKKQSRRKSQPKKFKMIKNPVCKTEVPILTDIGNKTL